MRVDRRAFLKGVAAAYADTRIPTNVYGLTKADAELIFPQYPIPGTEFRVRIHGRRTVTWPASVVWRSGTAPVPSGGTDLFGFRYVDKYWYGAAVQDLK